MRLLLNYWLNNLHCHPVEMGKNWASVYLSLPILGREERREIIESFCKIQILLKCGAECQDVAHCYFFSSLTRQGIQSFKWRKILPDRANNQY